MALTDNLGFAKAYPELSFLESMKISKDTGATNLHAATASRAFDTRRQQLTGQQPISDATFSGLTAPVKQFDPNSGANDTARMSALTQPIDAARTDILNAYRNSYQQADELSSIDETAIKKKLIFDMQPTADIDSRVKQLTSQSLVSKALLDEQYKNLPPSQRRALVADRLRVYSGTIDNLLEVRQKRLDTIDQQVSEQVSSMQRREQALTTRNTLLEKMSGELEKMGASREEQSMAQITLEKARAELSQMRKKMTGAGVSAGLGVRASGAFTDDEVNAFKVAKEAGALDTETAAGFFENLFGEGKGTHVTNATIRYKQWLEEDQAAASKTPSTFVTTPGFLQMYGS